MWLVGISSCDGLVYGACGKFPIRGFVDIGVMETASNDGFVIWGFRPAIGWFVELIGNSRIAILVHGGYGNLFSDGLIYGDYGKLPKRGFTFMKLTGTAFSNGNEVCSLWGFHPAMDWFMGLMGNASDTVSDPWSLCELYPATVSVYGGYGKFCWMKFP